MTGARLTKADLGAHLASIREARGLTQEEVVERMGEYIAQPPARTRVSKWETGKEEPSGLGLYAYLLVLEVVEPHGRVLEHLLLRELREVRALVGNLAGADAPPPSIRGPIS